MPRTRVNIAVEPDCETVRFSTPNLLIGEFRCGPDHARFREAGRIRNCVIAFPRHAVWIHRDDAAPFVADASVATVYSPGVAYERHRLSPLGGNADWFGLSEPLARDLVRDLAPARSENAHPLPLARAAVSAASYQAQRRLLESLSALGPVRANAIAIEEQGIAIARAILRDALGGPSARPRSPSAAARELVEAAKALILRQLDKNISVSDLAAALDVSPFHLCRSFRAVTGFTMHGYRRELRLRNALELAPRHRGRLSALALQLGFHSHAHFSAAYRAAFGAPPTEKTPRRAMA